MMRLIYGETVSKLFMVDFLWLQIVSTANAGGFISPSHGMPKLLKMKHSSSPLCTHVYKAVSELGVADLVPVYCNPI